jgi:hypothetical protein
MAKKKLRVAWVTDDLGCTLWAVDTKGKRISNGAILTLTGKGLFLFSGCVALPKEMKNDNGQICLASSTALQGNTYKYNSQPIEDDTEPKSVAE